MRTVKWNAFLSGLCGAAAFLGVVATGARAEITIEKGASILVFPKVVVDASTDTTIQIANTGPLPVHAKCYYVNAALYNTVTGGPCDTPSLTCVPLWQETDFNIWLTKYQPTHWVASRGRRVAIGPFGSDLAGFPVGLVPPVGDFFVGELKCVQVTESDEPLIGNHLKGEATLSLTAQPPPPAFVTDVSKYNAIGILGNPDAQAANPLLLNDAMYNACPEKLILNHFSTLSPDPVASDLNSRLLGVNLGSTTATSLTLVPCTEDFETQTPTSVTIQFVVYNEYEERFSASTTVTCYLDVELTKIDSPTSPERSIFSLPVLGSLVGHAELTPVPGPGGAARGVLGVVERFVVAAAEYDGAIAFDPASAAYNLHTKGSLVSETNPDQIRLTEKE
ncbi:hypothetical protein L6Q96_16085 [Candidatus Binatia bacterium]|nr:hypothetical protein [Candidatus Binatia bacterium]